MYRHRCREARYLKRGERMRDFVFGYNDGAVTTLAILTALVSSSVVDSFVVILGALASIIGSSISLAFSDYISVKSQIEVLKGFAMNRKLSRHEKDEAADIMSELDHPGKIAMNTAVSFAVAGFIALLPFFFMKDAPALVVSIIVTFSSVFVAGMLRSKYTHGNAMRSGAEMLAIAAIALIAAFFIGTYAPSLLGISVVV